MSRIVVTTIGSLGDLYPKVAIALELRRRGHQVVFATHQEYQSRIEPLGLEFHRMRPDNRALNDPQEAARMMDLRTGTEYVIRQWICASLRETYADLMAAACGADCLMAGEGVLVARMVAEKTGIPWISAVLQPTAFLSVHDPSVLPLFPGLAKLRGLGALVNRGMRQLLKMVSKSWAEPVHQLRQELGLSPLTGSPFIDDKYSPYLVLALFSSVLAQPQLDWPANTIVTGFPFYDGRDRGAALSPELEHFLQAGEPPIVFTLGSAAIMAPGRFFQESIQAAKRLNRRAVLLIGKNQLPEPLPPDMMAVDYVPHSLIFPRTCAIVHQGGIGTTAQALRAGQPTLIMPYSHDQPDNAARVERLGTSRTISRNRYTAQRAATELQRLLANPTYRTNAAEIGRRIQTENGVQVACDAIEKLLHV